MTALGSSSMRSVRIRRRAIRCSGRGIGRGAEPPSSFLARVDQQRFDPRGDPIRARCELGGREAADRMRDHGVWVARHAAQACHRFGGGDEWRRDDGGGRDAALLESDGVEHTARRAGPSVADRGDDGGAVLGKKPVSSAAAGALDWTWPRAPPPPRRGARAGVPPRARGAPFRGSCRWRGGRAWRRAGRPGRAQHGRRGGRARPESGSRMRDHVGTSSVTKGRCGRGSTRGRTRCVRRPLPRPPRSGFAGARGRDGRGWPRRPQTTRLGASARSGGRRPAGRAR